MLQSVDYTVCSFLHVQLREYDFLPVYVVRAAGHGPQQIEQDYGGP
jgi:hypothetical protein